MATQMGDTLTTRDAVRRAALDDIVARCELAAVPIEGGTLDGIQVVSMGVLRDKVLESMLVDLPPLSDNYAEVSTPASIEVDAVCPECGESVDVGLKLLARLVVQDGITEIAVKAKSKAVMHLHGQQRLPGIPGQVAAFDGNEVPPPATVDSVHALLYSLWKDDEDDGRTLTRADIEAWDQVTLELVADWAKDDGEGEEVDRPTVIADVGSVEAPPEPDGEVIADANGDELEHGEPDHLTDPAAEAAPLDSDSESSDSDLPAFMREETRPSELAEGGLEATAEAAVESTAAEMADVETTPECDGSNHVPYCKHFPQIPKRTPGDA